jgi:Protein of unknown function (DUF664)
VSNLIADSAAVPDGRMRAMTVLDEHGRPETPVAADEVATLLGFLDWQRATLAWKCSGLDAADLRATTAASTMTLGGILSLAATSPRSTVLPTNDDRRGGSRTAAGARPAS